MPGSRGRGIRRVRTRTLCVSVTRPSGVMIVGDRGTIMVEATAETAAEAAIETRMQSIEADFVTARERHTKKAAEVETNGTSEISRDRGRSRVGGADHAQEYEREARWREHEDDGQREHGDDGRREWRRHERGVGGRGRDGRGRRM